MSRISRRQFMGTAASASAAFSLFTISGTKASGRVLGANDRERVAVAGLNGRGEAHLNGYADLPHDAEITYFIDPDATQFERRIKQLVAKGGGTPKCVADVRQALDDPNLDALSIATPNHWHSLMTIWACQAGKDVYVEKPLSHSLWEGRQAVETARKYQRVVQHGTQKRSDPAIANMIAAVQSGQYGKLEVATGRCFKARKGIGFKQPTTPPETLDFNLWLGPAPQQPYHANLVHYNWHWFWDTGNGDIGNQGVHELDVARWGIPDATFPQRVWSLGGRFAYDDQGKTPNTQLAIYEYGEVTLVFEVRNILTEKDVSNVFYTSEGIIHDGRLNEDDGTYQQGIFQSKKGGAPEPLADMKVSVSPGGPFGNFINTVKSRNLDELNADLLKGHYSAGLCHLANLSYRLGEEVPLGTQPQSLQANSVAADEFAGLKEHLRDKANLNLDGLTYRLGKTLDFDPAAERFTTDAAANALLTTTYRPPFVVPHEV